MAPAKVYGPAMSTNVMRILVCLEEVGAEYEVVPVNMSTGEHKRPPHISRNPFGQVPAFEDGDLTLFESRAISKYILRKHGSDLLRESNLSESAMVDVWLEVESSHFDGATSPIIFQCFIVPMFMGGATDMGVVNESLENLKKALEVYQAQLSKSKYLAGDFISLADISHFPTVYYLLASAHASVLEAYPRVKAWIDDVMQRPSVKKVTEALKMPSA
uniref:glutathione transferase n=1 Tax=Oryza meridionalis TaxID=40149 RepID=A0A0E0C215_9ORYZ